MPRGPNGERRPADVIGNAVRIATGEEAEEAQARSVAAKLGRRAGKARAAKFKQGGTR